MTSSDPCEVCLMTGMMCRHRKTDLNHSMALFSDDGRNSNGPQEFQFFGIGDGSDSWLVDGPSYTVSGLPEVTVVAERGFKYTDFLRNNCDPSRLTFDVSLSSTNNSSTTTTASTVSSLRSPDVIGKTALTSMISLSSINTPREADEATLPAGGDAVDMDREARVLRYREKKKRRKFEKQIRYASRKAYAEMRPRVKGRFAKIPDISQPPAIPPAYNSGQYDMGWYQP